MHGGGHHRRYVQAWKLGLKCVAIYRDGSKRSQPLNTAKTGEGTEQDSAPAVDERIQELEEQLVGLQKQIDQPRRRLRDANSGHSQIRHRGPRGLPHHRPVRGQHTDEMFITMAKGSTIGGLMDSVAALTSISLQYGVPLDALVRKRHQRFEPSGFTNLGGPGPRRSSTMFAGWGAVYSGLHR